MYCYYIRILTMISTANFSITFSIKKILCAGAWNILHGFPLLPSYMILILVLLFIIVVDYSSTSVYQTAVGSRNLFLWPDFTSLTCNRQAFLSNFTECPTTASVAANITTPGKFAELHRSFLLGERPWNFLKFKTSHFLLPLTSKTFLNCVHYVLI